MTARKPDPDWLSTKEAAYLAYVGVHQVIKLCGRGLLRFWRVPGKGGVRRVSADSLHAFLAANGVPTDRLERYRARLRAQKGGT